MLGRFGRVVMTLLLVAEAIASGDASAATIRRTCRDGVIADRSGRVTTSCDVDRQCDGRCSFELPVCDGTSCQTRTFSVPIRGARTERMAVSLGAAPARVLLRCRPTPRSVRCVPPVTTTTTTVGGPTTTMGSGLPGPTTSTSLRLVGRASTSSTSTTTSTSGTGPSSSSTTTSLVPIPCEGDVDCDGLSSACAQGFCARDQLCAQSCFCVTPDRERTCALDEAVPCLTPNDCPRFVGDGCRLCYLNRCVIAPAPACF
jgi:hypothetical protein